MKVRKLLNPIYSAQETIGGITLSSTAGILYTTGQLEESGRVLDTSLTLGKAVGSVAILKGIFTFVEGLLYIAEAYRNKEGSQVTFPPTATSDDYSGLLDRERGGEHAHSRSLSDSVQTGQDEERFRAERRLAEQSRAPLAHDHSKFAVTDEDDFSTPAPAFRSTVKDGKHSDLGPETAEEASFYHTFDFNWLHGIIKSILGLGMIGGGIEKLADINKTGLPNALPWLFAINAWHEFYLTYQQYNADLHVKHQPSKLNRLKFSALLNLFAKGLEATGWTILALTGYTNPMGWLFMAVATLLYFIKDFRNIVQGGYEWAMNKKGSKDSTVDGSYTVKRSQDPSFDVVSWGEEDLDAGELQQTVDNGSDFSSEQGFDSRYGTGSAYEPNPRTGHQQKSRFNGDEQLPTSTVDASRKKSQGQKQRTASRNSVHQSAYHAGELDDQPFDGKLSGGAWSPDGRRDSSLVQSQQTLHIPSRLLTHGASAGAYAALSVPLHASFNAGNPPPRGVPLSGPPVRGADVSSRIKPTGRG